MKAHQPICIIVHKPETPEGQRELMFRTSTAHANTAISHIRNLNCSVKQKLALLNAVIQAVKSPGKL